MPLLAVAMIVSTIMAGCDQKTTTHTRRPTAPRTNTFAQGWTYDGIEIWVFKDWTVPLLPNKTGDQISWVSDDPRCNTRLVELRSSKHASISGSEVASLLGTANYKIHHEHETLVYFADHYSHTGQGILESAKAVVIIGNREFLATLTAPYNTYVEKQRAVEQFLILFGLRRAKQTSK